MKMKALLITCTFCLAAFAVEEPANSGNEAKVTVKVVDEEGKPVENATVIGGFEKAGHMRANTGADGVFVAKANIDSYYAWGHFVAEKDGFYMFDHEPYQGGSPKDGKWQPYNPTQTLVLKKIIKPIPMYAKHVGIKIRDFSQPIGYDLTEGDFLAPYGKGKIRDFSFTIKYEEPSEDDYIINANVTFSNPDDGLVPIQIRNYQPNYGSKLRMPHEAVEGGYIPQLHLENIRIVKDKKFKNDIKNDMNYFFRVRTMRNGKGEIVSANYGKIHGDFRIEPHMKYCSLHFDYYLNPAPNDRNVEFDPKQNLFKDLQSFDQVFDP
jgi:hypothetical protein